MATVHRIGFTELTRDAKRDRPRQLNVIFVHGLRGHPQLTWQDEVGTRDVTPDLNAIPSKRRLLNLPFRTKHSKSDVIHGTAQNAPRPSRRIFWLHDYLVEDLSEARIWTYGYNADLIGGMFEANNQNSVSQHGQDLAIKFERDITNQDPVVFVAHSLGGIIVKDALHRSNICQLRTKLVVFLGTPHRGSSYAAWGAIASNLACLALQSSNKKMLKSLKVNGEILDNIQEEFQGIIQKGGIRVHSFQEARGLSGLWGLESKVVDDFSSKLGLAPPLEMVESIDANHMQMARCKDRNDPQYRAILGVLKQFLRERVEYASLEIQTEHFRQGNIVEGKPTVRQLDKYIQTYSQAYYHIRLEKNSRFTGRSTILDEIEERFFVRKECRTIALAGLGGVGKTQVALQFAYRVKELYPEYSIFWVAALSAGSFEQAYTEIANKLGVQRSSDEEDIKEVLCQYLSSEKDRKWLLIVDNADDPELMFTSGTRPGIVSFLPSSEHGLMLLTTRSMEVAVDFAQSDIIEVGKLDFTEATEFLKKSLIQKEAALQDEVLVLNLLKHLAYLPLAIAQATAFLNQTKTTITKYLQLLQGAESEVVKLFSKEFRDRTRYDGLYNAVARTWLVSFEQIQQSNPKAIDLLAFLSCIEPKAIPQHMLPNPQSFETVSAIGILCGYSFLTRRGDGETFDMHSLVHMAARIWTQEQGQKETALKEAIRHLARTFPSNNWSDRDKWREYLPHASCIIDRTREHKLEDRYDLINNVGQCLEADRRFKDAIIFYEEVYEWKKEQFVENNASRLAAEHALASVYLDDRRIREAIVMFEHVVEVRREISDEKNHDRLASEHELARAYLDDRRIKEAIEMFEHVVEVQRGMLDEKDDFRLASEHELARAYLDDRRIKEAIKMFEHVVAVRKQTLDEKDHSRLASEHELARAYLDENRTREAIKMLKHVVAVRQETLDEKDHSRIISEAVLASAYLDGRRIKEAIEMFEHVVEVQREMLDEKDDFRLASEHELARAYLDDRRIKEAIEMLEHVVAIRRETLDEKDHSRLWSEHELARAYLAENRIRVAIEILKHVMAVREETLNEKDHSRLTSESLLASAYLDDRRIKEAIEMFKHVVDVQRETLHEKNDSRLTSEHELARAYLDDRRIKEATEMFEHVVAVRKETLDEMDHSRLASEHELARAYLNARRTKEATKMFEHVVDVQRETLDEKDDSRLTSEHELARAYLDGRRIKEAIEMFKHVVAVRMETLDEKNDSRLASEHELARAYLDDRQIKEAIEIFEHVVAVQRETLDEKDHSRLTSEHELARAYLADDQAQKAIDLLKHVVAVESELFDEDDPDRYLSPDLLQDAYEQLYAESEISRS